MGQGERIEISNPCPRTPLDPMMVLVASVDMFAKLRRMEMNHEVVDTQSCLATVYYNRVIISFKGLLSNRFLTVLEVLTTTCLNGGCFDAI
jgi:hypothetical protein